MKEPNQSASTQSGQIEDSLARLKAGNRRFASGQMKVQDLSAQRTQTIAGQDPFAFILGCVDSRVPPEIIFDQGIGDLFVARVAGNVVNEDMIASMEFATQFPNMKAIIVLGHTDCGAIKAACDGAQSGNLPHLIEKITPGLEAARAAGSKPTSDNPEFIRQASQYNVKNTLNSIRAKSRKLSQLESDGQLRLTGAIYDLETGVVEYLETT